MRTIQLTTAVLSFLILAGRADAGSDEEKVQKILHAETPFDHGKLELQSASGAYFSLGGSNRPSLNYSSTAYRFGIMLNSPAGEGLLRGNWECLLQIFGGSIFEGPGNGLGGVAVLLRYNFVQPATKWLPYLQIGAGGIYSDIWKDQNQRLIGRPWEFDLEAAIGVRYLFSDRWSAHLEGGYRHISNADLNDRNVGLNSLGVTVGLSRHF